MIKRIVPRLLSLLFAKDWLTTNLILIIGLLNIFDFHTYFMGILIVLIIAVVA